MDDPEATKLIKETNQQIAHTKAILEDIELSRKKFEAEMETFRENLANFHEVLKNIRT
jgi:hypothetical protein